MLDKTLREVLHAAAPWAVLIAWAVLCAATADALTMDSPLFVRVIVGIFLCLLLLVGLDAIRKSEL